MSKRGKRIVNRKEKKERKKKRRKRKADSTRSKPDQGEALLKLN